MTPAEQAREWLAELLGAAAVDEDAVLAAAAGRVAVEAVQSDPAALVLLLCPLVVIASPVASAAVEHYDGLPAAVAELFRGVA